MFKQRTGDASVEVPDDGKLVICRNADGGIRWQHPYPPSLAWRRFIKGNYGDGEHGIFLFAGFEATRPFALSSGRRTVSTSTLGTTQIREKLRIFTRRDDRKTGLARRVKG